MTQARSNGGVGARDTCTGALCATGAAGSAASALAAGANEVAACAYQ